MNIPQEELDKLNDVSPSEIFPSDEEEEIVEPVIEPVKKEEVSVSPEEDTVADKARIPYSRFETVNEEKIRAQERVKYLEEQLASKTTPDIKAEVDMPEEWIELYGDSDAAKRAYQLQMSVNQRFQEEATQKAIDRIESQKVEREEALQENLKSIDDELNNFSNTLGRKLTETEESAILDIQDEFTQKDKDGNYLVPLLSPEKAFEIHTLRQEKQVSQKRQAKNRVLSATGADSEGDVSTAPGANYNPNNWGSWRDKI